MRFRDAANQITHASEAPKRKVIGKVNGFHSSACNGRPFTRQTQLRVMPVVGAGIPNSSSSILGGMHWRTNNHQVFHPVYIKRAIEPQEKPIL